VTVVAGLSETTFRDPLLAKRIGKAAGAPAKKTKWWGVI
jgi:hypothetical protein